MVTVMNEVCPFDDPEYLSGIADAALQKAGIDAGGDDAVMAVSAVQEATVITIHCPTCVRFDGCAICTG